MSNKKRNLLTDSVSDFARYLQTEYLTNGDTFLAGRQVMYDRITTKIFLDDNPKLTLNQSMIDKYVERYYHLTSMNSKVMQDFLTGYTPFNIFYSAMINFILNLEAEQKTINMEDRPTIDREEQLALLTGSVVNEDNLMIFDGKVMRDRATSQRTVSIVDLQDRHFLYPFDLNAKDVMNLLAFEVPRAGLITKLTAQAPDDIISIYDYYEWIKKELIRRGILIQKVGPRLSIYDNTWINKDVPSSLETLVDLDTTDRGIGFTNITFEEGIKLVDKIIDIYQWGLSTAKIKGKHSEVVIEAPDGVKDYLNGVLRSRFAISLYDLGIGITYKEPNNVEQKELNGATIKDLQHLIRKILVQQEGVTSVNFEEERYEPGRDLTKVKLKKFLFYVDVELDLEVMNSIRF